jgi:hypothetical protein
LTGLLGDNAYLLSRAQENLGIAQLELVDLLGRINTGHQAFLIIVQRLLGRVWQLAEALKHIGLPLLGSLKGGGLDLGREAQTFPGCASAAIE